jgi:hypothetical protein
VSAAAGAALAVLVLMVVVIVLVIVVMVVVVVLVIVVMLAVVVMLHLLHGCGQGVNALHNVNDLLAVKLIPGSCYHGCVRVKLAEHSGRGDDLSVRCGACTAENDDIRIMNLIVEKLAEVADIHAAAACINNGDLRAYLAVGHTCNGLGNIGKLSDTGWLDKNAIGMVLLDDLLQCHGEVTDEGAADAAGVHLRNLNACVAQKSTVNGDLAELVLDEDELFVFIALCNELADERCFACSEKSGENVYFSQGYYLLIDIQSQKYIIPQLCEFANMS